MSVARNKEIAVLYTQLIDQGKVDQALELVDDACQYWHPMSGTASKEQTRAVMKGFLPMLQGFRSELRSVTAEENRASLELEARATTPAGVQYHNHYHFMMEFRDGKISAVREYVDTAPVKAAFFPGDAASPN